MEKNTLLAVALSVVVVVGFYFVQGLFFPPRQVPQEARGQSAGAPPEPAAAAPEAPVTQVPAAPAAEPAPGLAALSEERVVVDTGLVRAVLSSAGGDIVSYQLKEHAENESAGFVEMVLPRNSGGVSVPSHAFTVAFGGPGAKPVDAVFRVRRTSEYTVEFAREFTLSGGGRFVLVKKFEFQPKEYMFALTITLNRMDGAGGFDFGGAAYTLAYGPQMGPAFEKLDPRYEYRRFLTYTNGKLKTEKVGEREPLTLTNSTASWAAIAGKYFTVIAIPPPLPPYGLAFSAVSEPGVPAVSRLAVTRPAVDGSAARVEDVYHFYLGPKTQEALTVYNSGRNGFGLLDQQLVEAANTKGFLAPLEWLLKLLLLAFQKVVRNYGVAIILLTILVKALLFPLTKKQSEAAVRMQALAPKIKEIQDKYKANPQKMQTEMQAFYRKEGYSPLSGCLPLLIQIPIFFAMYNLFNNHFDLRGAMFIPGWIPDLSLPESVYHFGGGFRLPFLNWTDIRVLPFVYVGSQILYGKVTQTPDQQGSAQMKMMMYVMPLMFFFILYNVPSGLLIYWIMSNLLQMIQQLAINKYLAKRKADIAAEAAAAPVVPPKKRKRR
jgi:YidC/Oxa1 family membrane protein insertase